jgi:hypothetical protein
VAGAYDFLKREHREKQLSKTANNRDAAVHAPDARMLNNEELDTEWDQYDDHVQARKLR